ncbi:MAG: NmrA family NAD(P)-binding protein, partial [Chloroflexota bacterium]|nr:NmrA family NAD(P)-binding protein [Chloroflexota bacterium]
MILVAGATGFLGGEICRRLVAEDQPVRAIVRPTSDPARLAHLRTLGVETAQADLKDRASLDRACRGVSTVISTVSTTLSRQEGDSIERVDGQG